MYPSKQVYTPPEASYNSPHGSASSSTYAASPSALPWTGERTYLHVPYKEKDDAKKKGAQWDVQAKRWYAPAHADVNRFLRWWRPGPPVPPPPSPPAQPPTQPPAHPPTALHAAPHATQPAAAVAKEEADDCVVSGTRSREERDAKLRRSAVDVDEQQASQPGPQSQREVQLKRVKTESKPVVVAAAASPAAAMVAAAPSPPAAPPAAAGSPMKQLTVKQKVERIKEQLGLEAALPIGTAVAAALESLSMPQSGNLAAQIDALSSQLGLE